MYCKYVRKKCEKHAEPGDLKGNTGWLSHMVLFFASYRPNGLYVFCFRFLALEVCIHCLRAQLKLAHCLVGLVDANFELPNSAVKGSAALKLNNLSYLSLRRSQVIYYCLSHLSGIRLSHLEAYMTLGWTAFLGFVLRNVPSFGANCKLTKSSFSFNSCHWKVW